MTALRRGSPPFAPGGSSRAVGTPLPLPTPPRGSRISQGSTLPREGVGKKPPGEGLWDAPAAGQPHQPGIDLPEEVDGEEPAEGGIGERRAGAAEDARPTLGVDVLQPCGHRGILLNPRRRREPRSLSRLLCAGSRRFR